MMEGIWAVLCQAYEILSVHAGSSRTFSHYANVLNLGLKPTNPLCVSVCVCAKTNKWITWIGFSRWARCSGVSGGLCLAYDYKFKSRRRQHKQACENTKVCFFMCVWLSDTQLWRSVSLSLKFFFFPTGFEFDSRAYTHTPQITPCKLSGWCGAGVMEHCVPRCRVFPRHRLKP